MKWQLQGNNLKALIDAMPGTLDHVLSHVRDHTAFGLYSKLDVCQVVADAYFSRLSQHADDVKLWSDLINTVDAMGVHARVRKCILVFIEKLCALSRNGIPADSTGAVEEYLARFSTLNSTSKGASAIETIKELTEKSLTFEFGDIDVFKDQFGLVDRFASEEDVCSQVMI